MADYLFHGDPCARCPESRPGQPVRAASSHNTCRLCWLGMTERQRRDAIFDEAAEFFGDEQRARDAACLASLEALAELPTRDPEQHGEEDIAA
jgi:hypothetical protein